MTVPTPNLDKMLSIKEAAAPIQEFIDWYCDEFVYCSTPFGGMLDELSDETHREKVMAAYFDVDLKECENERMALLTDIRENNRQRAALKRRAKA